MPEGDALPSGHWEAHLLNVEEACYVGPDLTGLLGVTALCNEHVADGGAGLGLAHSAVTLSPLATPTTPLPHPLTPPKT